MRCQRCAVDTLAPDKGVDKLLAQTVKCVPIRG